MHTSMHTRMRAFTALHKRKHPYAYCINNMHAYMHACKPAMQQLQTLQTNMHERCMH